MSDVVLEDIQIVRNARLEDYEDVECVVFSNNDSDEYIRKFMPWFSRQFRSTVSLCICVSDEDICQF